MMKKTMTIQTIDMRRLRFHLALMLIVLATFTWSLLTPYNYFTWALEVLPAVIGIAVMAATYRRFRFTDLVYVLVCLHAVILIIGGKYTYELNPLFEHIKDLFGLERNYYDRLGHFAQGFVPAVIVRELIIRTSPLRPGKWLNFIVTSVCLAISAMYEFIEWWVAVAMGSTANSFLGSQGDVWDAQWDMFMAWIGAFTALILLSRLHNRRLGDIQRRIP